MYLPLNLNNYLNSFNTFKIKLEQGLISPLPHYILFGFQDFQFFPSSISLDNNFGHFPIHSKK